jgi:rhomboid protease GluP
MTDLPPSWTSNPPPQAAPQPPVQPAPAQRMIRVRRPTTRPTVTYAILGITVFAYLLQLATNAGILQGPFLALGQVMFGAETMQQLLQQGWGRDLLVLLGGKISPLIQMGQFWRLITPILLHDSSLPYGLLHIGFNMYALYALGPVLESYYGHGRYLGLYLLGGLGGNILSFLMSPGFTPSIGASTSLFGLITAWGIFIFLNRSILGPQARAMLNNVVMIVVINLALGLSGSIDNWGHLGGLITGLAFSWFAGPRLEVAYNYPEYELVDQRSATTSWLVGIVLFALLIGVVFLRISTS